MDHSSCILESSWQCKMNQEMQRQNINIQNWQLSERNIANTICVIIYNSIAKGAFGKYNHSTLWWCYNTFNQKNSATSVLHIFCCLKSKHEKGKICIIHKTKSSLLLLKVLSMTSFSKYDQITNFFLFKMRIFNFIKKSLVIVMKYLSICFLFLLQELNRILALQLWLFEYFNMNWHV